MATLPIRELGGVGIVSDSNPYDLPTNAFSNGNNVIFDEGRVQRAPVFKQIYPAIRSSKAWSTFTTSYNTETNTYESAEGDLINNSRFVGSYATANGQSAIIVADSTGEVRGYPGGVLTNFTPGGGLITNEEPWAATNISGLSVLSRKGMIPYARNLLTDSTYKLMSLGNWSSSDSCAVVRSYNDFLIAMNVTKGTTEYPTMVKWSDIVPYGAAVSAIDWDVSSTTNSAGENVLGELTSPLVDGAVLGTQFILYSANQVWAMEYTGSSLVFNFRRLFPTGGIINVNCVSEVEGKHYVFGVDDIYVHDGQTKKSIADTRVKRRIFRSLDTSKVKRFFVVHDSIVNLIYFCYVTKESEVGFPGTSYCNQAAVYNYRSDTWSFMDLPNIVGGSEATVDQVAGQYENVLNTYDSYNTSFLSFDAASAKMPVMLGSTDTNNTLTESRVYAVDLPTSGLISKPISMETFKPAFVAREGLDLDELKQDLRGYKQIRTIVPQAQFDGSDGTFTFQIGAADLPGGAITYSTTYTFDPKTDYKIDTKVAGRYLAYKITTNYMENFRISGFDTDIIATSKR